MYKVELLFVFWISNDSKISTMFWTNFRWKSAVVLAFGPQQLENAQRLIFGNCRHLLPMLWFFRLFHELDARCGTNQSAASTKLQLCRLLPQHRHRFGITFSESSLSVLLSSALVFFWPERKNSRCGGCLRVLFLWPPLAHVCCVRSVTLRLRLDGKTGAWRPQDSKTRDTQKTAGRQPARRLKTQPSP